MATRSVLAPHRAVITAALPVAAAIGVFGVVYGAVAAPVLGARLTLLSSLVLFSGAAQFTMVALLAAGATPVAVLAAIATLAARHLPLGAVLQRVMTAGRARRAVLSWFLTDETTGLALTVDAPAERTLAVGGGLAYAAWVLGTVVGAAGGSLASVEPLAEALFPVLFIGLAALTCRARADVVRALVAGAVCFGLLLVWPEAGALGAVGVAVAVAAVGRR